ncbi:MAG TPA: DUF2141 domain-containing protein [Rhodocyclaceae bacterium]
MRIRFSAALLCAGLVLAAQSACAQLTVVLNGVQHDRGSVRVGLYKDPATFRKEAHAYAIQQVPAQAGSVRVQFADLPSGDYAIMAYHDEDGNGELNRRFGMFPTEGYGLSKNPQVSGPPAFADSAFHVESGQAQELTINMRY